MPLPTAALVARCGRPVKRGMIGGDGKSRAAGERPLAASQEADMAARLRAVADSGDRGAFVGLFEHYGPRLKGYFRRLGADDAAADDLVQEVMLTIWRRAAQYDPAQASVATWLFTIARNRRIDAFRREKRPEIDPNDPALTPDPDPAADEIVQAARSQQHMAAALLALPQEQAQLIRMAYYEDKSHSTIAQELDLPLGTVKSRVRLGLAKLRASMKDLV